MEIATEIDKNVNPKKASGIDEILSGFLKELKKKTIVMRPTC